MDNEFLAFCKTKGFTCPFTVKGTPQQDRVTQMMNRTLLQKARCLMYCPKSLRLSLSIYLLRGANNNNFFPSN